ncbi:hypothetical protein ACHAXN_000277 [Cyclotella atomus]|jgi:hypothetical protein
MGNVAIAFIESSMALNDFLQSKYAARLESKRIATLIPRYISCLNRSDSTITTLNLNNLGVDCNVVKKLAIPLTANMNLCVEELYLEHNKIGPEGATCIARIISKDACLKIVSLSHNFIGSMGAMALASAIESNSTLERLNLSHCGIDNAGVLKLAASLKRNSSLKYLNLEGNPISSEGIYALFNSVYDTSNGIASLWDCNHTIRTFHNGMTSLYSPSFPDTHANRLLCRKMSDILAYCNCRQTSRKTAASRKILRYFYNDPDLYMHTLENTHDHLVPCLMSWLGNRGNVGVVYDVVRAMPHFLELRKSTEEVDNTSKLDQSERKRKLGDSADSLDEACAIEECDEQITKICKEC